MENGHLQPSLENLERITVVLAEEQMIAPKLIELAGVNTPYR